jgi:hypothetical protein
MLGAVKIMFNLFNERKTKLANGKEVREGDKISFIDSDRNKHEGLIQIRQFNCKHSDTGEVLKKGTLFFWNNTFKPSDYYTADVVD